MYPINKEENYQSFGGINVQTSSYTTNKNEFLDLRNFTLERLGSLTTRPGTETNITLPVSQYLKKPYNSYVYQKEDGSSFLMFDSGTTLSALGSTLMAVDGTLTENATTSTLIDFITANDTLYYSPNGLRKFNGTDAIKVSVSEISTSPLPNQVTFNTGLGGATVIVPSDSYYFRAAWLRGTPSLTDGKINGFFSVTANKYGFPAQDNLSLFVLGATIVNQGQFQAWGFSAPPMEGVSAITVAYSRVGTGITNFVYSAPLSFTLTTIAGITTYLTNFPFITTSGFSYTVRSPVTQGVDRLAWYNNMIFASKNNTVDVSDLDDVESFPPENQFQISGNPSDPIVALVVFQGSIVAFKEDSIHEIKGDSPETLQITDVSFDYGCTSPRGYCVFENRLFFVDKKYICEYLGTNIEPQSDRIEPLIDLASKNQMTGLHVKKLNQVWFGDGENTFVYDYIADAWLIYDGHPIDKDSGLINIDYGSNRIDPFYWRVGASYHLGIRFGDSLATDLGQAITMSFKTKYHQRDEYSTTEIWRRFYMNVDVPSVTLGVTLNLRPNYGVTIALTKSMPMVLFQQRVDFGIPARSLSIEMILKASERVRINGYTIESRYLRST